MKEILLHPAEVSEFAIVTFTPGEHFPVDSQRSGMPASCNVHTEVAAQVADGKLTA